MVLQAAKAMDVLGNKEARVYVSAVKAMVPEKSVSLSIRLYKCMVQQVFLSGHPSPICIPTCDI